MFEFGLLPATVFFGSAIAVLATNGVQGVADSRTALPNVKAVVQQLAESKSDDALAPVGAIPGFGALGGVVKSQDEPEVKSEDRKPAMVNPAPATSLSDIVRELNAYFQGRDQSFTEGSYRAAVQAQADRYFNQSDKRWSDLAPAGAAGKPDNGKTIFVNQARLSVHFYAVKDGLSNWQLKRLGGSEKLEALEAEFNLQDDMGQTTYITGGDPKLDRGSTVGMWTGGEYMTVDSIQVLPGEDHPTITPERHQLGVGIEAFKVRLTANALVLGDAILEVSGEPAGMEVETQDGGLMLQHPSIDRREIRGDWEIPFGKRLVVEMLAPNSAGSKGGCEIAVIEVGAVERVEVKPDSGLYQFLTRQD